VGRRYQKFPRRSSLVPTRWGPRKHWRAKRQPRPPEGRAAIGASRRSIAPSRPRGYL